MKANILSSFASGLLVSASICGAVYFSEPKSSEKKSEKETQPPTIEEMKMALSSSGYVIMTDKELDEQLAAAQPKKEVAKETKQEEKEEAVVYRTIVTVASGMTSIDVGRALVQGKIIDNAKTFFNEVEKRGLSNELKPGTFELDSTMSLDEVVKTIFK